MASKKRKLEPEPMAQPKKPETLVIAVDVEKKGKGFQHPVINLGVAWGYSLDKIETASFSFDYKKAPFEKRCYDEFWSKNLDVLKRIEAAAKEPKAEWKRFDELLTTLNKSAAKIKFESDNPAYDMSAIDYHLFVELGRDPMRYMADGAYRKVCDSSERIKALPAAVAKEIEERVVKLAPHTHWAADDARGMLVRKFLVDEAVAKLQ